MQLSRNMRFGIYYLGVFALIAVGVGLWLSGHGTGDPYLTLGVVLALVPVVVSWLRRRLGRH